MIKKFFTSLILFSIFLITKQSYSATFSERKEFNKVLNGFFQKQYF